MPVEIELTVASRKAMAARREAERRTVDPRPVWQVFDRDVGQGRAS
jgi:hypothetical protein